MALTAKLQQKQAQSLVMTPQLLQSIRLLQYGHLELAAFLQREAESNPLLVLEDETSSLATTDESAQDTVSESIRPPESQPTSKGDSKTEYESSRNLTQGARYSAGNHPGGERGPDSNIAAPTGLAEHLEAQLSATVLPMAHRLVARELIHSLDDDGYLRIPLAEIGKRLGMEERRIEPILRMIQQFEPVGVAARSLSECLAIQLRERNRLDPAMEILLDGLEFLARRDYQRLSRMCGLEIDEILDMAGEIRSLDPRPGNRFSIDNTQLATPDILVTPGPDGGWAVELNNELLPRVLVDREYHARIAKQCRGDREKTFLIDCLQSANWLVRSLDQRARTILKVATEIVKQQDAFLVSGVEHLRPLTLRKVADAIGMHESTVSRVTSNKYMMTPRGLFELKYFFTAPIASAEGVEAHSAESVRHRIRQLVDAESPDDILSDDAIVSMLRGAGIEIARRTVAKYRESLAIPSSVQRRREKRALLARQS